MLVGPNVPHGVLRDCAERRGAGGFFTCEDVLGGGQKTTTTPTEADDEAVFDYDVENTRIATAALTILREQISGTERGGKERSRAFSAGRVRAPDDGQVREGTSLRPSCRFEEIDVPAPESTGKGTGRSVRVVLDVAHNPDAMTHLVSKLRSSYPNRPLRIVAGFSSDKDLSKCGSAVLSAADGDPSRVHLVEASHPRAAGLEEIL